MANTDIKLLAEFSVVYGVGEGGEKKENKILNYINLFSLFCLVSPVTKVETLCFSDLDGVVENLFLLISISALFPQFRLILNVLVLDVCSDLC